MRRVIAGAALVLSLAGCTGGPSISWPGVIKSQPYRQGYNTAMRSTSTVQPTTSMAPRPVATSWSGTWTYAGYTYPADLQLFNTDPISGEIHIPGWCDATWSEVQRTSETSRLVRAHVISGNCHDNRWNVTVLLPNSITGTDTVDLTTTFEFTPQSS
jgi:hypothetical protein